MIINSFPTISGLSSLKEMQNGSEKSQTVAIVAPKPPNSSKPPSTSITSNISRTNKLKQQLHKQMIQTDNVQQVETTSKPNTDSIVPKLNINVPNTVHGMKTEE